MEEESLNVSHADNLTRISHEVKNHQWKPITLFWDKQHPLFDASVTPCINRWFRFVKPITSRFSSWKSCKTSLRQAITRLKSMLSDADKLKHLKPTQWGFQWRKHYSLFFCTIFFNFLRLNKQVHGWQISVFKNNDWKLWLSQSKWFSPIFEKFSTAPDTSILFTTFIHPLQGIHVNEM